MTRVAIRERRNLRPSSAAYNKIPSEKEVVIYPDYGHEDLKGNSDIVFNFLAEL